MVVRRTASSVTHGSSRWLSARSTILLIASDRLHTLGLLDGVSVDVVVHDPHMRTRGSSRALQVQPLHVANRLYLAVSLAQHVGCDA